jgi:enterochelin esterase family protein
MNKQFTVVLATPSLLFLFVLAAFSQQTPKPSAPPRMPAFKPTPNDTLISPEVLPDKRVTFRVYAPGARSVKVRGEWITKFPDMLAGIDLQKSENGVWSATLGPLAPGIYRYSYLSDGLQLADPRNPSSSQSLNFVQSMVAIPGLDYQDIKEVPHGAVETVWYHSKVLGTLRRMHIYTPPGYANDAAKYPVFYLLHGAGDSDDSWSTVGRAGFILDNLIAAQQAKPMIVVMPAGHTTSTFVFGGPSTLNTGQFEKDFLQEILPYVESHYRVLTDRPNRAIAGLSMGGMHALNISIADLKKFAYIGVFSSGWFFPNPETVEQQNAARLDDASAKNGLRLFWFATGKDDFVLSSTRTTVDILKKHGFNIEFKETAGAHTWENWRAYLHEFAPRLFQ